METNEIDELNDYLNYLKSYTLPTIVVNAFETRLTAKQNEIARLQAFLAERKEELNLLEKVIKNANSKKSENE